VVETADFVDNVDAVQAHDWWHSACGDPYLGEHLHISERMVIAPVAGTFTQALGLVPPGHGWSSAPGSARTARHRARAQIRPFAALGAYVSEGDLVGRIGSTDVRTPFAGSVAGFLVHSGEKVSVGQPVAWLRAAATVEGFD
jgi:biotin carboxyl carrier protein